MVDGSNISALVEGSQGLLGSGLPIRASQKVPEVTSNGLETSRPFSSASKMDDRLNHHDHSMPVGQSVTVSASEIAQKRMSSDDAEDGPIKARSGLHYTSPPPSKDGLPSKSIASQTKVGRTKLDNIDLNNVCDDSEDYVGKVGRPHAPENSGNGLFSHPLWVQPDSYKSSPPQTSGNSDSTSSQSPSSTSGETQVCSCCDCLFPFIIDRFGSTYKCAYCGGWFHCSGLSLLPKYI